MPGIVIKVDTDYFGASQAFKIYKEVPRGNTIRSNMIDGIGPTKDGKRDRVLVLWTGRGYAYEDSKDLVMISKC